MSKNKLMTYLLQSPAYLLGYLAILGFGWSAGRFKDSVWHVVSMSCRCIWTVAETIRLVPSFYPASAPSCSSPL